MRRKTDPNAKPPHKRKWYFRIEYKCSAMQLAEGKLRLSNGKGNEPLVLEWPWDLPQTVVIHWTGVQYEAIATYLQERPHGPFPEGEFAGIDLGEIHMAVSHDGQQTHLLNGRYLRSKVQYRNKLQAKLNSRIDGRMHKGSRRRKQLIASKKRQLKKIEHQIKDIEHKSTTHLISTLHENGVQTVVIGDVRAIRQDNDVGHTNNQKIHQWSHGSVRHKLTYKAERYGHGCSLAGGKLFQPDLPALPVCAEQGQGARVPLSRSASGCTTAMELAAINIRQKYLGHGPVVGVMAPPISIRLVAGVARTEKTYVRENVCVGNRTEAATALA